MFALPVTATGWPSFLTITRTPAICPQERWRWAGAAPSAIWFIAPVVGSLALFVTYWLQGRAFRPEAPSLCLLPEANLLSSSGPQGCAKMVQLHDASSHLILCKSLFCHVARCAKLYDEKKVAEEVKLCVLHRRNCTKLVQFLKELCVHFSRIFLCHILRNCIAFSRRLHHCHCTFDFLKVLTSPHVPPVWVFRPQLNDVYFVLALLYLLRRTVGSNSEVVKAMAEALSAVKRLQMVLDLGEARGRGQCRFDVFFVLFFSYSLYFI